jgi:hypothetical protein
MKGFNKGATEEVRTETPLFMVTSSFADGLM